MAWVDKIEIPVDLVVEKQVKKIPQVKSFNMGTSIAKIIAILVFVRSARLGMSFVVLVRKLVPTAVLILEKGIKMSQLGREERRVCRKIFYPHLMNDI